MKIIFINRFFYPDHSATSQLLTDLAFYLAEKGLLVEVVTSRQIYDDAGSALASEEFINGVHVRRVWTSSFGRSSLVGRALDYLTFYAATFIRLLKDTKPGDVLVAKTDPPLISVIVSVVASIRSAKLINWVQDLFPEVATALTVKGMNGGAAAFLKTLRNWSLKKATMNVVLGERMKQRLISEIGAAEKIQIINNWSDSEQIRPVPDHKNPLIKEWQLDDKFVVGYSGNMGRAHEFQSIVDAAEALLGNNDIVFLFIGGGIQRDWIAEQAGNRGLSNVIIKPYQPRENLSNSLGVIDLHLISLNPALEGLIVPSKFYGIAAVGRPILFVGDTEGEIAQILREEDCGTSIKPGDSSAIVEYILTLKDSREYCELLGGNARNTLVNRFSISRALDLWDMTIKSVIETKD